jgi:antirestriction protein
VGYFYKKFFNKFEKLCGIIAHRQLNGKKMTDNCAALNEAVTIDEHIHAIETMMAMCGSETLVNIEANHNNVEFIINGDCIEQLQDYNGSLNNLLRIFTDLKTKYGNSRVLTESGYNNAFWWMV